MPYTIIFENGGKLLSGKKHDGDVEPKDGDDKTQDFMFALFIQEDKEESSTSPPQPHLPFAQRKVCK